MQRLTVTLETVTPLFLGGAEPRGAPELRASSFRGALRYWLRAALGGVVGDNDLKALHYLESSVFGSIEFGSPVHIRLKPLGEVQVNSTPILPHIEGPHVGSRRAIQPEQKFEITLFMPYLARPEVWEAAIAALRLAVTFGGIGLRSRRGYGTLRVVRSNDDRLPPSPTSLQGWKQLIEQVAKNAIDACRELAQARKVPVLAQPLDGLTRFPCASKQSLIMISDLGKQNAMDAVRAFMQRVSRDPAFGGISPRQASPLWIRPIKTEKGYSLLFLVLASQLKVGTDYTKVRAFLDKEFPGEVLQVKGWNV